MNDIGYIDIEYKNSYLHNSIGSGMEQLVECKRYTKMAIEFHTKEQNPKQEFFFTEHLKEIERRIDKIKNESFKRWKDLYAKDTKLDDHTLRNIFNAIDYWKKRSH